jgi:methylmalonyl-CoA mutase cobalamin-binding domain/chain
MAIGLQHLQHAAHDPAVAFDRLVGVGVGADRDHPRAIAPRGQFLGQHKGRVGLGGELRLEIEAGRKAEPRMARPREAVDAAVLAAAVGIDRTVEGQIGRAVLGDDTAQERAMSDEEDDIILSELDDDELVQQMFDDLYDGLKEEIEEGVNILLERGWAPYQVLTEALVGGMTIVGNDFRDGILFVPEVLLAANAMKGGMFILKPLLAETGAPRVGKMVIGTVKGDIHDIGKNLVSMMMEGAGFEVVDLGINNPVENYLEALETEEPDILGMSALLTTTMPYMKVVIDTMVEKGIRDDYIVLVGGAPLNEEFGKAIGADAYCRDAAVAVETAKSSSRASTTSRGGAGSRARIDGARQAPRLGHRGVPAQSRRRRGQGIRLASGRRARAGL